MIETKNGVDLNGLKPVMWQVGVCIDELFSFYNLNAIITSALDGVHGVGSLHKLGLALDFRTFHLPGGYLGDVARQVFSIAKSRLKPRGFDVVLEKDHMHIEYQPKPVKVPAVTLKAA